MHYCPGEFEWRLAEASPGQVANPASQETAEQLMDQLSDAIKHGKITSDPNATVDLAHRTVDAADHELIGAWKTVKPVFDALEPRMTPAHREMKKVLDEAKTKSGSLSEPEKGQVDKLLTQVNKRPVERHRYRSAVTESRSHNIGDHIACHDSDTSVISKP